MSQRLRLRHVAEFAIGIPALAGYAIFWRTMILFQRRRQGRGSSGRRLANP